MSPAVRRSLSLLPLALQFLASVSAMAVISFFLPVLSAFLAEHEGKFMVPGPTRLLVEHTAAAKLIVFGFFAFSAISFVATRYKMKEEADQVVMQSTVYGVIWYVGIVYVGGVLMAAALPYFALHNQ